MTAILDGTSQVILHLGYPTGSFRAPLIYNPFFEAKDVKAAVVPLGVRAEDFPALFPLLFRASNVSGALITMPHKVRVVSMLDRVSDAVRIAGACNAVRKAADGALEGDLFDGEGFARAMIANKQPIAGRSALMVGCGGVGAAIAAALAGHGLARLRLDDREPEAVEGLAGRLLAAFPGLQIERGSRDPDGMEIVINASPLGMKPDDPMPVPIERLAPDSYVGDVVMAEERTAFLRAAQARGARIQIGLDMLYAQIPAYLAYFGLPVTTADELRALSRVPKA